jgi:23S rRNA (uracil1939-C5)-methyltransferase
MLQCKIDGISHQGEGIARVNGMATFIPGAIPGETVQAELSEKRRRFQRARLIEVLDPSPHRVEPPCPHYYTCGGCSYQHMSYEAELACKRRVVSENLRHLGGLACDVAPIIGMNSPWRYRNKVTFHLANLNGLNCLGYYQAESHKLIPVSTCLLISTTMENILHELNEFVKELEPLQGQVTIRQDAWGRILVFWQVNDMNQSIKTRLGNAISADNIICSDNKGELQIIKGNPWLDEKIGDLHYRLSPLAFFQVNRTQCQILYDKVKTLACLDSSMRVLDAYCGTGTIALYLAAEAGEIIGVEAFAPAIEDAKFNAGLNGMHNCQFNAAPCEVLLPQLKQDFDLVVVDPPRAGCSPLVLDALSNKMPSSIIYVSCNPGTLARDLKQLTSHGYAIGQVQPIDMFPRTRHVECVTLMSRL